ncbi:hypothetical protein [Blastococcus capsensis]|uniref:hypothetical protein n=1 Tax=Blastococcus capsensis TaxID=1564163 RepID=UPI002540D027|nr:hypothetical protein [Blastococcus capsensis]MDK3258892.1 hypothetical protein [Blastococcus capsensis]
MAEEYGMASVGGRERLSGMTGVATVVLWILGVLVIGGGHLGFPGGLPEERASEVAAFYVTGADRVLAGSWAFMLGALCFVWFTARLSTALSPERSGPSIENITRLSSGTGLVTGILLALCAAAGVVTALTGRTLDPAAVQALDGVGGIFFIGAEVTGVVMLAALSVLARRSGALPRAWSVASLALAVWLAVLPIGWVGLIVGVPLWTLVTAVLLLRRDDPHGTPAVSEDDHPAAVTERG